MAENVLSAPSDVFGLLSELASREKVYLAPPATEAAIEHMQDAARNSLGEPVPDEYVKLLRFADGLEIQDAFFKEAENLVPENLDLGFPEVMVLGTDGGMAYYVFDRRDRRYHTIGLGDPDERLASYATFEEMLLEVMKEQSVV